MKIKRFNESLESIQKRLKTLENLRDIVVRAETDMEGAYLMPFASPEYADLKEVNREFNDLIQRLKKFDRILGEEIEKI